jgi:hypothetical protein
MSRKLVIDRKKKLVEEILAGKGAKTEAHEESIDEEKEVKKKTKKKKD